MTMMDMKIVQDEKTREEETRTPEWIRNPSIQVVVIPRRRIISNHWRAFIVVVLVNYRRRNGFDAQRWLTLSVLPGTRCNS
jgi:hypothetical protein